MQQPDNNRLPSAHDLQLARKLAESNATTNHFLGATRRPWMTNSVPIPGLPVQGRAHHVPPSLDTTGSDNISGPAASETVGNDISAEALVQHVETSQPAQNHGTFAMVEQMPATCPSNDNARKISIDVADSDLTAWRRGVLQPMQQPCFTSSIPPSDPLRAPRLPAMDEVQMIIMSAMHSLNNSEATLGMLSTIESQRFSLLKDACVQKDAFYLCLHQIFCAAFINPIPKLATGFGEEQYAGLNLLTLILLSNHDLSAKVLNFFADLPAPIEVLTEGHIMYQRIIGDVGAFLRRFAGGWGLLRNKCFARKHPPFVDELARVFELHSPVLQRVLFISIHRQLGATDDIAWGKQGLALFDTNQAQYQARIKNHDNAEIGLQSTNLAEQNRLGEQYKALWKDANKMTLQSAPAENIVAGAQPSPLPILISQNQDPLGTLPTRRASATLPFSPNSQQSLNYIPWSPFQNPSSRSQSTNTLQINTGLSNNSTTGPFSASRVQKMPSSMNSPNFVLRSSPSGTDNSPTSLGGHVRQQVPHLRRRGRPPFSNRPVMPHIIPSVPQRSGRGGRGGRGGQGSFRSPADLSPINTIPLIPASGYEPIQTSTPNPDRLALHQAHLRSPVAEKINAIGHRVGDIKLYQYLEAFAIPPRPINNENWMFNWMFLVTASEMSKKAVDVTVSDGQTKRMVSDGCIIYRLRSIEVDNSVHTIEGGMWSVKDTSWPSSCFVRINEVDIELRRKLHHGKDLPVDLTPHVREGRNNITIALLSNRDQKTAKRYAMAVEIVEVGDRTRVDSAPTGLAADEALRSITQGLATSDKTTTCEDDDELQVVDSHISIDLVDPFMSTMFVIPARGKGCSHRECFDLQTFFQTRKSRVKDGPTSPDEWKCPICKKDARPQSLVVDCFLKTVRDSLVASGAGTDARAILVASDGSWTIKREGADTTRTREDSNATVMGSPMTSKGTLTGNASRSESVVIEIDDE